MSLLNRIWFAQRHPIAWVNVTLFYLLLCGGLWLHSSFVSLIALTGIVIVTLFSPAPKHPVKWASDLIEHSERLWVALPFKMKAAAMGVGLIATALLLFGCWIHWVSLIVLGAIGVITVKTAFFLGMLNDSDVVKTDDDKSDDED